MADTDPDDTAPTNSGTDEGRTPEDKSDTDVYVDRDKIDFDPDDGLLSGTAIDGNTDIPGPHENVDDVLPDDSEGESSAGSDEDAAGDEDPEDDEVEQDESDADDDATGDQDEADERDGR